jgi:hypothetical protein
LEKPTLKMQQLTPRLQLPKPSTYKPWSKEQTRSLFVKLSKKISSERSYICEGGAFQKDPEDKVFGLDDQQASESERS